MASTYQIDPNDLERLRSDPKQLRRDLKQLRSDLRQLRSTDQAERQASSRRIAPLFHSEDYQEEAKYVIEGLFSEVMPVIVMRLKISTQSTSDCERLSAFVRETLIRVWHLRKSYDPACCDIGAWMLHHARIVLHEMSAKSKADKA